MNYFIYNGKSSIEFDIRIQSKNIYSAPKYDAATIAVPGRDGDLLNPSGRFSNVNVAYTCYVPAKSIQELSDKITSIKNWLYEAVNQYHDLQDSYDTNFKRKAVFNNKLDISDQVKKIGVFTVNFSCHPFRYSLDGFEPITLRTINFSTESKTIINPFSFASKPYLKIYGNGVGTLIIQNSEVNKIWRLEIDDYIEIDSEKMNCFKGTLLRNDRVTGDGFPMFAKGENSITISGDITAIDIIPRWLSL